MKTTGQRAFCPVWAEKIEVKREDDVLLVRGWGHALCHVDVREGMDPSQVARLNLLEQFRKYRLQQLSEKPAAPEAGIYQFADATDDEKLVAFVRVFGPVWGSIRELEADALFHMHTVTVAQELGTLRQAQRIFAAATKLLAEINRNGLAHVGRITEALMTIFPAPSFSLPNLSLLPAEIAKLVAPNRPGTVEGEFYPWTWSMLAVHTLTGEKAKDRRQQLILLYAHHGLCQLLNSNLLKPDLFPADGRQPIELPPIRKEGILSALYYKLRLDYLAQRQIGICENCGGHFPILKRGARACGEPCRRALRNRKYWDKEKKAINSNRKRQSTKRKQTNPSKKGR